MDLKTRNRIGATVLKATEALPTHQELLVGMRSTAVLEMDLDLEGARWNASLPSWLWLCRAAALVLLAGLLPLGLTAEEKEKDEKGAEPGKEEKQAEAPSRVKRGANGEVTI